MALPVLRARYAKEMLAHMQVAHITLLSNPPSVSTIATPHPILPLQMFVVVKSHNSYLILYPFAK